MIGMSYKIRSLSLVVFLFMTTFVCFSITYENLGLAEVPPSQDSIIVTNDYSNQNNNPKLDSYSFGHQTDFWTVNLQTNTWFEVRATLLSVGNHCYLYMDNRTISTIGQSEAIERCRIYASEFDHTIYPKNFELMGHPDGTLGDVDGDPLITVFLVEGVGNYYLQTNELPDSTITNNREMVYVNSNMGLYNTIETICHETNHLFLFNYDLNEGRYFIEGLAEFSMYYAGYRNNESFVVWSELNLNNTHSSYYYSHYPDVSMRYFDATYFSIGSYGASYMFLLYVSERYGINIISELVPIDELDGPEALEYVLLENGYNISFNEVFLNFITACTIDKLGIYDDLYGFVNTEFQIYTRKYVRSLPSSSLETVYRYYGTEIHELVEPPNEFTLKFETPESPRSLGLSAVIVDKIGYNVTQKIIAGDGNNVYLHFTGEDIESAYIITSNIKEITPNPVREWMSSPINLLDLNFVSGHTIPSTEETSIIFISIVLPVISTMYLLKRRRRI